MREIYEVRLNVTFSNEFQRILVYPGPYIPLVDTFIIRLSTNRKSTIMKEKRVSFKQRYTIARKGPTNVEYYPNFLWRVSTILISVLRLKIFNKQNDDGPLFFAEEEISFNRPNFGVELLDRILFLSS